MDSEEKIIIAFIFKRSGKTELKSSEIYFPLSLELGWFSSQQAQNFVHAAVQHKLLKQKKEKLTPGFDIDTITIPIGFQPSKQTYLPLKEKKLDITEEEKKEETLETTIITYICEKTNQQKDSIEKRIQQLKEEKHIVSEVAALLVAREHTLDISGFLKRVEHTILKENTT